MFFKFLYEEGMFIVKVDLFFSKINYHDGLTRYQVRGIK